MDSGCGTLTTELTSVMSSVVSRTVTSEPQPRPVVQQSSHQQSGITVSQPAKKPLASPSAGPATCPAKPQRQHAIARYCKVECFTHCSVVFVIFIYIAALFVSDDTHSEFTVNVF